MTKLFRENNIYYVIAVVTFFVFMFFEFFGTSLPFRDRVEEIDEIGQSNIINQFVYSFLFIISVISIFKKRSDFYSFVKQEKLLTLFFLWCLISMIWSIDPFVTFKRFLRIITLYTVVVSLLLNTNSTRDILRFLKPVLYLYVFISVASCLVIPGAIDPQFGTWRGLTMHKNSLGQESVICILLSLFIFNRERGLAKIFAAIPLLFSIALLFGSMSMTSITSFMVIVGVGGVLYIDELFKPLRLGRVVSFLIISSSVLIGILIFLFLPDILSIFTGAVGKDVTFSGRTDLWLSMLFEISKHPLLGTGYQAFWNLNNPAIIQIYDVFTWLPNEAHNGYLDIINEVGIVGFIIFLLAIINYFKNVKKLDRSHPWIWFITVALIINLQESTLFRPGHLVGAMVVIAYLVLFSQLRSQQIEEEIEENYDVDEMENQQLSQQIL